MFTSHVCLFMHGSKLSEFIQSDVPSNTLLLIPNEFGTVLERLEELEIQSVFAAGARNNFAQQVIRSTLTFKATRIAFSLRFFVAAIRSIET